VVVVVVVFVVVWVVVVFVVVFVGGDASGFKTASPAVTLPTGTVVAGSCDGDTDVILTASAAGIVAPMPNGCECDSML
jgi:hypothetical protein